MGAAVITSRRKIGDGSSGLTVDIGICALGGPLHLLHRLLRQLASLLVGHTPRRGRELMRGVLVLHLLLGRDG